MASKITRNALILALLSAPAFGQAAKPVAAPATQPGTPATQPGAPTTRPGAALPEVKIPNDLTGAQLATRAQQAFSRGEYATALPMLRRMAAESEDQPAKLASIQERIRVCEKALASAKAELEAKSAKGVDPLAGPTNLPETSPEARKPHPAPKTGAVYEVDIQTLGNFDYDQEKGGNVPEDIRKLGGAVVRLKGYMIPMDQAENITQFALVPSLFACCFGQPPQIQHTVVVNCPKGKAVGYTADEIVVEGTLKVQEKKDDGYIISLFEMEVASVKVAPRS